MAQKPIQLVNGRLTEVEATVTSAGAGDSGELVALDSTGRLDTSVMPVGIGADTATVTAGENLAAGDFVYIWADGSPNDIKASKAIADAAGKEAVGFVLAVSTTGNPASVYFEGQNNQLSGLTPGTRYYLSAASAGDATATAPTGASQVVQFLGIAVSADTLSFEATDGIVRSA